MSDPMLQILDQVGAAVYTVDVGEDGLARYSSINKHGEKFLGWQVKDVLGRTALEAFGGRFGAIAYARHREVIETAQTVVFEADMKQPESTRALRMTLSPQCDDMGRVTRIIGTCVDITKEKIAKLGEERMRGVNSEIEQFISMAAHDLRTPMRNVKVLAELLREGFEDHGDERVQLIDMLEQVAGKSMSLITDILSYAEATNIHETVSTFDFVSLCQNISDVLDPQTAHCIKVTPAGLSADKAAMQVILRNLLDNAFRHGGKEHLQLEVQVQEQKGGMIEVSVRDDGNGFENPGRIFLQNGTFRVESGYGLFGIRRIIQLRGGTINAMNASDGKGGIVRFTLPGEIVSKAPSRYSKCEMNGQDGTSTPESIYKAS